MNFPSEQMLTKTPQGVNATRSGLGLPPKAHAMLKLLDGAMPVAAFKAACLGASISEADFQSTLQELVKREHLRVAADAAGVAVPTPGAVAERRLLQTLDFTVVDDPAEALTVVPEATLPENADAPAAPAASDAPVGAAADDKAMRLRREAEIRQKLVADLQPRIEEELREKLRPQLERELRPKLIAALRPAIETEVRAALSKELAPRVELELKARFAKTMAAQRAADPRPAQPDVEPAGPGESLQARVVAGAGAPLFGVDKQGVCNYLSPAWERFSGFPVAEALGRPLADFFAEADRRAVGNLLTGLSSGNALRHAQQGALRRKDGETVWVEISGAPLTAADGTLIGACGTLHDAGELRRALDQAEADGVRLLLLIEEVDSAVLLEDAGGNIQQANAALCALLSLEVAPHSLEGMPVAELLENSAGRFIGPEGYLQRIAQLRAAEADVKGASFVMADGRVIEKDYLAVTVGEQTVGRLWLFREMGRTPPRGTP